MTTTAPQARSSLRSSSESSGFATREKRLGLKHELRKHVSPLFEIDAQLAQFRV